MTRRYTGIYTGQKLIVVFGFIAAVVGLSALSGLICMALWNWVIVGLFHASPIGSWMGAFGRAFGKVQVGTKVNQKLPEGVIPTEDGLKYLITEDGLFAIAYEPYPTSILTEDEAAFLITEDEFNYLQYN